MTSIIQKDLLQLEARTPPTIGASELGLYADSSDSNRPKIRQGSTDYEVLNLRNRVLNTNITEVGNVGTGADTLISYTVPANTLANAGETLHWIAAARFAATAVNKQLEALFGAAVLLDTGTLVTSLATDILLEGWIIVESGTVQKAITKLVGQASDGSTLMKVDYTAPNQTLSGGLALFLRGTATNNDDIVNEFLKVYFER